MPNLSISLLGPPQITLDGDPVKIPTSRAMPLLAYLALSGQPQIARNSGKLTLDG